MERWISLKKFMEMYNVGYEVALQMLDSGKYDYQKTENGKYKIRIGGDTVPREQYEKALKRISELETVIKSAQLVIGQAVAQKGV